MLRIRYPKIWFSYTSNIKDSTLSIIENIRFNDSGETFMFQFDFIM